MPDTETKPPMSEEGYVLQYGADHKDLISWASVVDERETNRALAFPQSVDTYRMMRSTDAQIAAILAAITSPIRNFAWGITANGARDEVVEFVARNLNLPIVGAEDEPRPRSRNRFNHDRHLASVLRGMLTFGWQMHEQVGELVDGQVHYRKIAARPQHTITQIDVGRDGGLIGIKQGYGSDAPYVPVGKLVAYVWNQEEGQWTGESMLRPMYRPWKIKDRIMRVGAINIERAGGVPWVEAGKDANTREMQLAMEFAQQFRVGETSAGALPFGWQLKFAQAAGGAEAAQYVRLMNEEMTMVALAGFLNLGKTETGSRALAEGFIDFFSLQLGTIAGDYAAITNEHVILDLVDWNYGADEQAPLLTFDRNPSAVLDVSELTSLVSSGLIVVDNDLEDQLRGKYKLGEAVRPDEAPSNAPAFGYDLDNPILRIDDRRAQLGLDPREDGLGSLTVPEFLSMLKQQEAASPATSEGAATVALGSDFVAAAKRQVTRERIVVGEAVYAAKDPDGRVKLPARDLRRSPTSDEVMAALDLEAMDATWTDALLALVEAWKLIRSAQINAITSQLEDATSLADLLLLDLPGEGETLLQDAMIELVAEGIEQAMAEAGEQGVTLTEPEIDALADEITERASVISQMLADELKNAAVRKAASLAGDDYDADVVAAGTRSHLESLKDGWLETQLGGLLTNAVNTGRYAAMESGEDEALEYIVTSILDTNTCSPCAQLDGRTYTALNDALIDFPTAGYKDCEGGLKCRCFYYARYAEGDEIAAAKKSNRPGGKKVARNNFGEFGTKNKRLQAIKDRIKRNRLGGNREKSVATPASAMSADDKIANYRKMTGKDPSAAQVKKLRDAEEREDKQSSGKLPALAKAAKEHIADLISDKLFVARKENKFLDDETRSSIMENVIPELEVLSQKLDAAKTDEDAKRIIDERQANLRNIARPENKFIDADNREGVNMVLADIADLKDAVGVNDANNESKGGGDAGKSVTKLEGIFGRKLDADERDVIAAMFKTAAPKPSKPKAERKPKKPKGEGGEGGTGSGSSKGGGSAKPKGEAKPAKPNPKLTLKEKREAATAVLEEELGRKLTEGERRSVAQMAIRKPAVTVEGGSESGGSSVQGGGGEPKPAEVPAPAAPKAVEAPPVPVAQTAKPTETPTARKKRAKEFIEERLREIQATTVGIQFDPYGDVQVAARGQRMALGDVLPKIKKARATESIDEIVREEIDKLQVRADDGFQGANNQTYARLGIIELERVAAELDTVDVLAAKGNAKPAKVATPIDEIPQASSGSGVVEHLQPSLYYRKGRYAYRRKSPLWPTKRHEALFRSGVDRVKQVHDPDILVALQGGDAGAGAAAAYGPWEVPPAAPHIEVDKESGKQSVVHELGHAIDQQVFGIRAEAGDSDRYPGENERFYGSEMSASDPDHTLRDWYETTVPAFVETYDERVDLHHPWNSAYYKITKRSYYTSPREVFARSYEQWIATKTGDPEALAKYYGTEETDTMPALRPGGAVPWSEEEFAPIAAAFDRLFGVTDA